MNAEINYSPRSDEKRKIWSMKISPRLKYRAELFAREEDCSLSSLVERAIEQVLPLQWGEGLWDADEATRFFLLATGRHDLLTLAEQRFWQLFTLGYVGNSFTIDDFRAFWDSPSINTAHLSEGKE